jgi:hypothetical protein
VSHSSFVSPFGLIIASIGIQLQGETNLKMRDLERPAPATRHFGVLHRFTIPNEACRLIATPLYERAKLPLL